jgi:hypothetical protein
MPLCQPIDLKGATGGVTALHERSYQAVQCRKGFALAGESAEAWRTVLDDLITRGLRRPEFLIVDGAPGLEKAIAAVWDGYDSIRKLNSSF